MWLGILLCLVQSAKEKCGGKKPSKSTSGNIHHHIEDVSSVENRSNLSLIIIINIYYLNQKWFEEYVFAPLPSFCFLHFTSRCFFTCSVDWLGHWRVFILGRFLSIFPCERSGSLVLVQYGAPLYINCISLRLVLLNYPFECDKIQKTIEQSLNSI